jgi:imidazolonepropionase-like amidohydrolase
MPKPKLLVLIYLSLLLFGRCDSPTSIEKPFFDVPDELTASRVAFVDVNVVPMDDERILPRQTVIIQDRRIVEIGPEGTVAVAADVPQLNGNGTAYLMPGLADMHVHMRHSEDNDLFLYIANGVTTVREMNGRSRTLRFREDVKNGVLEGPTIYAASPTMNGPSGGGSSGVTTTDQARGLVRQYKSLGYDFLKVYTFLSSAVYFAIMDEAKAQEIGVAGHVPNAVTLESTLEAGQSSLEHLWGFAEEASSTGVPYSIFSDALDLDIVRTLAQQAKEAAVWVCATVGANTLSATDAQRIKTSDAFQYLSPRMRDRFLEGSFQGHVDARQSLANVNDIIQVLLGEEVNLLLGTDAGFGYMLPGFVIHDELKDLVAAGLSPYQALQAGTANAAKYFDAEDEFGTVAVGRRADLIMIEANPLEGVSHVDERVGVMVKGHWYSEKMLKERLQETAASYGE